MGSLGEIVLNETLIAGTIRYAPGNELATKLLSIVKTHRGPRVVFTDKDIVKYKSVGFTVRIRKRKVIHED